MRLNASGYGKLKNSGFIQNMKKFEKTSTISLKTQFRQIAIVYL